jgi:HEAT repeat protein
VGWIGSDAEAAVPALIEGLHGDPKWEVRSQTAEALGDINPEDNRVVSALVKALNDENLNVRRVVARNLKQIDPLMTEERR